MHPQQLRKKAKLRPSSSFIGRTSGPSSSYLKTRIRGSRLQNPALILAFIELTQRLHQPYRQAYDKQATDWLLPQNYSQQRQDLKGDRGIRHPVLNIKREYLTPCVQKYLSKFFGGQSLAGIEVQRDYLPPIAPNDALAFTNTGSLISFNKGQYQPNTKEGIALIGHEIEHNFQARKYGDSIFAMLYLGDSAALFYQFQDLGLAYFGNRFEKEAFAKQNEIEKDLAKNGNPCPP